MAVETDPAATTPPNDEKCRCESDDDPDQLAHSHAIFGVPKLKSLTTTRLVVGVECLVWGRRLVLRSRPCAAHRCSGWRNNLLTTSQPARHSRKTRARIARLPHRCRRAMHPPRRSGRKPGHRAAGCAARPDAQLRIAHPPCV